MKQQRHGAIAAEHQRVGKDYVWATSEHTRLRALSLYLIRSIVEKHGGNIDMEMETGTICIDVPKENEVDCAREIYEQVSAICL